MKVVLFCGGLGMRIREYDQNVPKPMVPIGYRPILWHVMKYYAHFGHRDFILCLGHRADVIKDYFRNYDETISNDFVLSGGGRRIELLRNDIQDWRITFVDSGITASIGQRLWAVRQHLDGEQEFFANYSDGLTDLPLPAQLAHFRAQACVASVLSVRPHLTYHFMVARPEGHVTSIQDVLQTGLRINGGFFIFRREIFDYLGAGEDLMDAFQRLLGRQRLVAYPYDGFWQSMDTFRDKQRLDDMHAHGKAPWEVWENGLPEGLPVRLPRRRRAAGPC